MLLVMTSQQHIAGGGCGMQEDFSPVASQREKYQVRWSLVQHSSFTVSQGWEISFFFCIDVFLYYIVLCTFLCLLWCKTDTYIKRKYSNNFHGNVSAMYNVKHLASE